jgi:hypothetical protein
VNLARLTAAGAAIRAAAPAPVALDLDCETLRRTLDPAYARERAREERYAARSGRVKGARGNSTSIGTEPFCGDCFAVRSPTSATCPACGSAQPPNLSRMNPRAARIIGQGGLR